MPVLERIQKLCGYQGRQHHGAVNQRAKGLDKLQVEHIGLSDLT
jgi:hypothetical protein